MTKTVAVTDKENQGLFGFQVEGSDFLAQRGVGFLFDQMGLGKTVQAIRGADKQKAYRILVICQAVARVNWQREFSRFGMLPRVTHVVTGRKGTIPANVDVVIINYDNVVAHISSFMGDAFRRRADSALPRANDWQ